MPTKYLVLRTNVPRDESFSLSSPSAWLESTPGPTKLDIATYDGHEVDAADLRADPRNAAVMDAEVALALIKPTSEAASTLTTGLKQVGMVRVADGVVAVGASTSPFTGQGITVAVLDTGIDETHPAFQGKTIAKCNLTTTGDAHDVRDDGGHGTHCAATICGVPVGDLRVGVAPGVAKLCVGKVLGSGGGGTLEMLLKGMFWAVLQEHASVVSMSLGYDLAGNTGRMIAKGYDPSLAAAAAMRQQSDIIKGISTLKAFLESQSPNVVFVAASGNESRRPQFVLDASLPAAELVAVGAVGPVGPAADKWDVAAFSNGRAQLVAPGVNVVSAAPGGGWAVMSGTSMATPHAAGIAALWTEKLRNEGALNVPESVRSAMRAGAVTQPLVSKDRGAVGAGMVQAPSS